jgi:predicted permease
MNWLGGVVAGLKALFHKEQSNRDLDRELAQFLDASTAHQQNRGLSPAEARRAARLEMGSAASVRQQIWESRWESVVENCFQDLRLSIRFLLKRPGFTCVALLSLALGIGANAAIFTLVRQVMLQELPVRDPQLLVSFGSQESGGIGGGIDTGQVGLFPWYFARELEHNPGPFQGIAAFCSFSDKAVVRRAFSRDSANSRAATVPASLVSGNYFQVLGASAMMGRTILPADAAAPGSTAVVVLSYPFWRSYFSSDSQVIGQTVVLNNAAFRVIGVMPKQFEGMMMGAEPVALWAPDTMQSAVLHMPSLLTPNSGQYFLHMFGRLAPEAAKDKAAQRRSEAWLNLKIHNSIRAHEGSGITPARAQEINRELVPLLEASHGVSSVRSQYGNTLLVLMAAVVLILLIACANLANFLLARAAASRREIATRLALGSSRARIISQGVIEALVLSFTGALLGLMLAFGFTGSLISFISQGNNLTALSPAPDAPVLIFTLAVSIFTGLLFGFVPAWLASRTDNSLAANFTTRTSQAASASRLWPKALVAVQIAFSLMLLIGAGLFLQTLRNLQGEDYGFERTHLLIAQFDPRLAGYTPKQTEGLHNRLIGRLHQIPGVRSVALAITPPINTGGWSSSISIPGYTPAPKESMESMLNRVSGEYFETTGIAIISGRPIRNADALGRQKVVVVNETLAKRFFPKGDAVGRSLSIDGDAEKGPWQIVGIARNTKFGDPRDTDPGRMTYIPLAQIEPFLPGEKSKPPVENQDRFVFTILVRTAGDAGRMAGPFQSALSSVDPNLPVLNVLTVQQQISNFMMHDELISTLTTLFSVLALLLASIGLYGVMSHNVERRHAEISIRLALGAQVSGIRWMVLQESFKLLAIGVVCGIPLALAFKDFLVHQLFGLSPLDPATYIIAIAMVVAMTVFASSLPAYRASRVDPIMGLRAE